MFQMFGLVLSVSVCLRSCFPHSQCPVLGLEGCVESLTSIRGVCSACRTWAILILQVSFVGLS